MAAKSLESDLDFAFQIQMQEAIAASFAFRPSGLTASPPSGDRTDVVPLTGDNDEVLGVAETLLLRDMESYMQEYQDRKHSEAETSSARENLDRRIHDQRLANDVLTLADEDYRSKYGDWYEKPHGSSCDSGSSSLASSSKRLAESEDLRLYFKGLVNEESNVPVAGAGIAIFDHNDNLLFHARKNLEAFDGAEMISGEAAELEALVEGLNKALAFGFNMITFCCDDYTIFHYVSNTLPPRDGKIAALVNQVALLQRKFTFCSPSLVTHDHIYKFVFESAREAIVTQISWSEESGKGQTLKETCLICFEDTDVAQMFSIDGCLHRYCFSCMKQHVEAKMHNGQIAKCPHDGCNSEVAIDSCAKFIPPNLVEIMDQRIKESAIPVTEKVYCPEPKCSALMSKNEVLEYTKASFIGAEQSGARKCMKCRKFFCINCKVPWHYTMTCDDYRRLNAHKHGDEQMLKTLATNKRWRQCAKCNHMVELLEGCYHITCRCKYEFCYICGAEWKNKRATCFCLIWDELNIVRVRLPHPQLILELYPEPQPQQQQQLRPELGPGLGLQQHLPAGPGLGLELRPLQHPLPLQLPQQLQLRPGLQLQQQPQRQQQLQPRQQHMQPQHQLHLQLPQQQQLQQRLHLRPGLELGLQLQQQPQQQHQLHLQLPQQQQVQPRLPLGSGLELGQQLQRQPQQQQQVQPRLPLGSGLELGQQLQQQPQQQHQLHLQLPQQQQEVQPRLPLGSGLELGQQLQQQPQQQHQLHLQLPQQQQQVQPRLPLGSGLELGQELQQQPQHNSNCNHSPDPDRENCNHSTNYCNDNDNRNKRIICDDNCNSNVNFDHN